MSCTRSGHFFGSWSRQMRDRLRREGWGVGRKRVRRLMRLMDLEAQCPKPNLSRPAKGHKIYPYLMRWLKVDRPNKAWCADITYIRMEEGFARRDFASLNGGYNGEGKVYASPPFQGGEVKCKPDLCSSLFAATA